MLEQAEQKLIEKRQEAQSEGDDLALEKAESRIRNFKQIANYWLLDFAGLSDRTRSVIVSTFTSKVTGLTRFPLYELLCTGKVGERPFVDIVKATREGKVVIVNLPVKRYTEVGRFAQVLIKTVWQRAIERHPDDGRPVFLWADEAQFFATKEDMLFQTTARSSRCATVYLTQNICNYYAMMPGRDPKSVTDSLLGNLATKIFHANGDPSTNEWAQRLFGNERSYTTSSSVNNSGGPNPSTSLQQGATETQPIPIVQAKDFRSLRKGGIHDGNDRWVDAIILQSGKKQGLVRASFRQHERQPPIPNA